MKYKDIKDVKERTYLLARSDSSSRPFTLTKSYDYAYRYPEKPNPWKSTDLLRFQGAYFRPVRSYSASRIRYKSFMFQVTSVVPADRWNPRVEIYNYGTIEPLPMYPYWLNMMFSQHDIQANVEFLNKLNDRRVSLIEEMRNRKDTIDAFIGAAARMGRLYKSCLRDPVRFVKNARNKSRRKGRPVTARAVKTVGDAWLEGRYQWIPTYLTLEKAFVGLKDTGYLGRIYKKFDHNPVHWSQDYGGPNIIFTSNVQGNFSVSRDIEMGCWIHIDNDAMALARRYGAGGFTDLAAVAWELTPWSLVVDWVVPVTDILLALNATAGIKTFNAWRAVTTRVKFHGLNGVGLPSDKDYYGKFLQQGELQEYERYERMPINIDNLEIRPYIATPSDFQKVLRAVDALSFFSGSKMSQKIISGRI